MYETVKEDGPEFQNDDKILEKAKELFSKSVSHTLTYRNKATNIKWISLVSESPLVIRLIQRRASGSYERIISKESFSSTNTLPEKIKSSLWNNRWTISRDWVKNPELLKILKIFDSWNWSKVYIQSNIEKKKVSYFQSESWLIYEFKISSYY